MNYPVTRHPVHHLPVGCGLPEGGVERVIVRKDRDRFIGVTRPELRIHGIPGFSHHRLAPKIVKLDNEVGIMMVGRFLEHVSISKFPGGVPLQAILAGPQDRSSNMTSEHEEDTWTF